MNINPSDSAAPSPTALPAGDLARKIDAFLEALEAYFLALLGSLATPVTTRIGATREAFAQIFADLAAGQSFPTCPAQDAAAEADCRQARARRAARHARHLRQARHFAKPTQRTHARCILAACRSEMSAVVGILAEIIGTEGAGSARGGRDG